MLTDEPERLNSRTNPRAQDAAWWRMSGGVGFSIGLGPLLLVAALLVLVVGVWMLLRR
jgi:hypothetical protein